jgi:alkanesulfonate monooxygenase SsuD/methylene tetrahydromethanopterin reductase-like flavin-dependent oxidoreductase (luciferase family)
VDAASAAEDFSIALYAADHIERIKFLIAHWPGSVTPARAIGAPGNTSCLVGTPEQVAAAVLKYYRLGIPSFLLRGFENPQGTMAIGRDLIPLIRASAAEIDRREPSTLSPSRPRGADRRSAECP